jgi:phosphatidylserine decarboxylase
MMLSPYAKNEWTTITAIGVLLTIASVFVGWWWLAFLILPVTAALLAFFRDPNRKTPSQRGAVIAPADGRVSSIHEVEHFEPFGGPATCIRIFLSVLDVHINRSPCHGHVTSVAHKPGDHKNALNPNSAETNESNLIVLVHPIRRHPLAAVRQVAGLLARTIACGVHEGDVVQRGQRIGMIKLGSTTELYLPAELQPKVAIQQGQMVYAGLTVVATVVSKDLVDEKPDSSGPESHPATPQAAPQPAQSASQ